jgi:hypothetical protein
MDPVTLALVVAALLLLFKKSGTPPPTDASGKVKLPSGNQNPPSGPQGLIWIWFDWIPNNQGNGCFGVNSPYPGALPAGYVWQQDNDVDKTWYAHHTGGA